MTAHWEFDLPPYPVIDTTDEDDGRADVADWDYGDSEVEVWDDLVNGAADREARRTD